MLFCLFVSMIWQKLPGMLIIQNTLPRCTLRTPTPQTHSHSYFSPSFKFPKVRHQPDLLRGSFGEFTRLACVIFSNGFSGLHCTSVCCILLKAKTNSFEPPLGNIFRPLYHSQCEASPLQSKKCLLCWTEMLPAPDSCWLWFLYGLDLTKTLYLV